LLGQNYLTDEGELDNAILFRFQLRGLGSFGVSDDKIDNLISGYQAVEEVL
jgi:LPS-assembly protein